MTKLTNPRPLFLSARGALLDGGYIFIGVANADPEAQPIPVFFDAAMTIPAAQPLRTLGGVIVNGATPAFVFFADTDYSYRVRDADMDLIDYVPSRAVALVAYQPEDADLTAIAALSTTLFGRSLLTLANQAALKAATGIPDPLPLAGGQVTGNITRQAAGVHSYWANPAMTGGRQYVTATTAAKPANYGQPGDTLDRYVP